MKIKVLTFDDPGEQIIICKTFEFRTNTQTNWIKYKTLTNETVYIDNVCVIKYLSDTNESE